MNRQSDECGALFKVRCGNRDVFAIGMLFEFCDNKLGIADWEFVAKRAQSVFGARPVHFLDCSEQQRQTKTQFTGYRITANRAAFNPQNPDTIEYAILIWHQTSALLHVTNETLQQIANINWEQIALPMDY